MNIYQYILRRLMFAIPVLLVVSLFAFSLIHLAPGSPVSLLVPKRLGEEARAQKAEELGLDCPLHIQYFNFLKGFFTWDLGESYYYKQDISVLILDRIPNTLNMTGLALVISYFIAIPAGVLAAVFHGKLIDLLAMVVALVGLAMPQFWLGLLLLFFFSVQLGWFPTSGTGSFMHLILPAITFGAYGAAMTSRLTRSSMLEVLNKDYINTARAKGLSERIVLYKHALRNAVSPIISLLGMRLGWLIGGAVMVEVVFNRPGIGRLLINSIYRRDYLVTQTVILLLSFSVIIGNLIADVLYGLTDPKIRYE